MAANVSRMEEYFCQLIRQKVRVEEAFANCVPKIEIEPVGATDRVNVDIGDQTFVVRPVDLKNALLNLIETHIYLTRNLVEIDTRK